MSWIKLQIRPEHNKVLAICDITGQPTDRVYTAVIRWFFWVDDHAEDHNINLSFRAFREVTRWDGDGLAAAMLDPGVDWLTDSGGLLSPTRWETHMSNGAKVRALTAKRASRVRGACAISNASSVTKSAPREDKRREENTPPPPSQYVCGATDTADGGGGGVPVVQMDQNQHEAYLALLDRPNWLPASTPWIDQVTAKDLALLPTTTKESVAFWGRQARNKRTQLSNPAGFVVAKLTKAAK